VAVIRCIYYYQIFLVKMAYNIVGFYVFYPDHDHVFRSKEHSKTYAYNIIIYRHISTLSFAKIERIWFILVGFRIFYEIKRLKTKKMQNLLRNCFRF